MHCSHPSTHTKTSDWARTTMMKTYISEVASPSSQEKGLHYFVGGITEERLQNFNINTISQTMSAGAPCLWELIGGLLMADVDLKSRREKRQEHAVRKGGGLTLMSIACQPMTDHGSYLIRVFQ